jgi:hypothetical protein
MNAMNTAADAPTSRDFDFYAWTQDQAARLRAAKPATLDWENIADELEALGENDRSTIESDLTEILTQLLKVRHLHERATFGWRRALTVGRQRISDLTRKSPSLRTLPEAKLPFQYTVSRERAAAEAGLLTHQLPVNCPFTVKQVLDQEYWPEPVEE